MMIKLELPDDATNGDMIKAIFPNIEIEQIEDITDVYGMSKCRVTYDTDWWNAPYKAESDIEKRKEWPHKPCINYEDGCEEWAGCPCVYYKGESEDNE